MPGPHRFSRLRGVRFLRPNPLRIKVAVFMLPLLLPVGQNLSQQPVGAARADEEPVPPTAGVSGGSLANPDPVGAVPAACPEPSP